MPNSGSFAGLRADLNDPRWGPEGLAWAAAVGGAQDAELQKLRTAALCRLPQYVPDDGLDECGKGFVLPRFPGEANAAYRGRLVQAFAAYKIAGSAAAIITQLQAAGFGDVFLLPVWQSPAPFDPEVATTNYAEFYVFLGPSFGSTGITTSMTGAQVALVTGVVLKWKSAHSVPIKIVLQTSGTAGAPTTASGTTYPIARSTLGDTWAPLDDPNSRLGGYF